MALPAALSDLLDQTVTIYAVSTKDFYGKPTYGSGSSRSARVEPSVKLVRDPEGKECPSRANIYMDGDVTITTSHKITLPDGTSPPILQVAKHTDDDGTVHHTKVIV